MAVTRPNTVHPGLANVALGNVRALRPDDPPDIISQAAWEMYRQLTRYAPGCSRDDFIAWASGRLDKTGEQL